MNFASKYGYNYGNSGSDSEEISDEEESTKQRVRRQIRKADSNVISLRFDRLVLANETHAGEPTKCRQCQAIMSLTSKDNVKIDGDSKLWTCEFCYEQNDVSQMSVEEIPTQNDVTYLVEPAPEKQTQMETSEAKDVKSLDDNYLVYCIDISGSMDTYIPIKTEENEQQQKQKQRPRNNNESNMTRLSGVKAACIENLTHLKDDEPNRRVGLVTFSSDLKYFGDGTKCVNNQPIAQVGSDNMSFGYQRPSNQGNIFQRAANRIGFGSSLHSPISPVTEQESTRDLLNNQEKLIAYAHNLDGNLKSIKETYSNLEQRMKLLRTEGSTALGPALAFSIGFSSKKAGSQVILCTDGCANVGMGSLQYGNSKESEKFYEDIADYAKERGVVVNIISMEGTDCKLSMLGKVADRSNGTMNIVNPLNLADQFKSILENRLVATNVKVKLIVNLKYLYIRDEELEAAEAKAIEKNDEKAKEALNASRKSIIEQDIGNVNIDTELTFEYGVRKLNESERASAKEFKELPFQIQITYTSSDGSKAMRVYTRSQEFTKDRSIAEREVISNDLLMANCAQKMSYQVVSDNIGVAKYRNQQMQNYMASNMLAPSAEYQSRSRLVSNFSKSKKLSDLNDDEANEMYSGKKLSRSKMSKK